jgi:hypothetical protein
MSPHDGSWEPKHVVKENKYDTKVNIILIVLQTSVVLSALLDHNH